MMIMLINQLDIENTSWKLGLNHMIIFVWVKKLNILEIMVAAGSIFEKNDKYYKQFFYSYKQLQYDRINNSKGTELIKQVHQKSVCFVKTVEKKWP